MKRILIFFLCSVFSLGLLQAQQTYSLEDFRKMAMDNNKSLKVSKEEINAAKSMKKAAATQYLPNFSASGTYLYFSENLSLLSEDKLAPVGVPTAEGMKWTGEFAYLPKESFTVDNENVFMGGFSMVQPVFMGGKIRELNKLAGYSIQLAEAREEGETSELIYNVDAAYWQMVSVSNKLKLTTEYKALIEKLNHDVEAMVEEGMATQSDLLRVRVKLNEAELNFLKTENGLSLSRMLLCELAGLPLNSQFALADNQPSGENQSSSEGIDHRSGEDLKEKAFENRPELKQLNLATRMAHSNVRIQQSRFLPNIGLTANYLWTNPNPFNGFEKEFKGFWNVGVAVSIPIFHWGERVHTLNAAKAEYRAGQFKLEDAKEKINLQVQQASFKINEANKRLLMTAQNLTNAEENLRMAEEGFKEGVINLSDFMAAQVAWQAANSEHIDADIDARLCKVYLQKAVGELGNKDE